jgi:hypothetical protein
MGFMGKKEGSMAGKDLKKEEMPNNSDTLYSLVSQTQAIEKMLIEAGGELTPELEAMLDNVDVSMAQKIDGYAFVMEDCESRAAFWKAKADTYSKLAKSHAAIQERIKERLKAALIQLGKDEVQGNEIRFKLSKLNPKIVIWNEAELPDDFKIIVQTKAPDKERIQESLKEGFEVPGVRVEPVYSLRKYAARKEK